MVLVCTSADDPSEAQLASALANRLMAMLTANRLPADRISTEPCRMRNLHRAAASEQDGQRIGIVLERRS